MLSGSFGPYAIAATIAVAFASAVFALLYPYISGDREKDKRVKSVAENRPRKTGTMVQTMRLAAGKSPLPILSKRSIAGPKPRKKSHFV
jgi:hypothetical protein